MKNNNNTENNTVILHTKTNYLTAQTWQIRYEAVSRYSILPLRTGARSVAYYNDALRISTNGGTNSQQWRLEKVDNGKFVFDGDYYIKSSNSGYISHSGNTLTITNSPTTLWHISHVDNNYYRISITVGSVVKYFDVLNAADFEGNTVHIYPMTSHPEAQKWKFMLQNDGTVLIVPQLSLTRGVRLNTTSFDLSINASSWILERED